MTFYCPIGQEMLNFEQIAVNQVNQAAEQEVSSTDKVVLVLHNQWYNDVRQLIFK